jgi:hypothetical protein
MTAMMGAVLPIAMLPIPMAIPITAMGVKMADYRTNNHDTMWSVGAAMAGGPTMEAGAATITRAGHRCATDDHRRCNGKSKKPVHTQLHRLIPAVDTRLLRSNPRSCAAVS